KNSPSTSRPGLPSGMTLLEVLVSLSIFLGSFAAVSQLFNLGSRAAIRAALETQAVLRCESKLAELVAGVESLEAGEATPYEDDPRWNWSLVVNAAEQNPSLMEVVVTVAFQPEAGPEGHRFSLTRLLLDPQVVLDAEEEAAAAAEEAEAP
ncbi:MAG: prepilin-type N-terminal cleavage/methylation domain-containing protein, partial [Planctomycetaceae bacterium]